jgi:hypothetical protein
MPAPKKLARGFNPRFQRFECKYLISEEKARAIRRYIRPYVEVDPYAAGTPDNSYMISSLYLDGSDLRLFWESRNGIKDRIKLRIRNYNGSTRAPVFLEIKRRRNRLVRKGRARIDQDAAALMLAGRAPDTSHLSSAERSCYDEFVGWVARWATQPIVWVGYRREAYVGAFNPGIRITMDRDIACSPAAGRPVCTCFGRERPPDTLWRRVENTRVILELKFNVAFPDWMRDLVQRFDLQQRSYSKYGNSVMRGVDSWRLSSKEAWSLPGS